MFIKLLYAPDTGKILGAQITGTKGVDKRIDQLAATLRYKGTVYDLEELELSYAPPFFSAKDPVNMASRLRRIFLLLRLLLCAICYRKFILQQPLGYFDAFRSLKFSLNFKPL